MYNGKKWNQKNMKECGRRNSHISSKLQMIHISSNDGWHPVTKTFTTLVYSSPSYTSLHYTCRHFTSHLNFTQLHFTTLSFGLTPFKFPTAPFHLTSLHFTLLLDDFRLTCCTYFWRRQIGFFIKGVSTSSSLYCSSSKQVCLVDWFGLCKEGPNVTSDLCSRKRICLITTTCK